MQFFKFSKQQKLRLRRTRLALWGGAILTLICIILFQQQLFRLTLTQFVILLGTFWAINLCFLIIIVSGVNRYFKDPSLTIPQMIWAISCVMFALLFATKLRGYILMMALLAMMFGVFKFKLKDFLYVVCYIALCYVGVIYYLTLDPPPDFVLSAEITGFVIYLLILFCFSLICAELRGSKEHLFDKTTLLETGLQNIEQLTYTDELTKIRNRRFIMIALEKQRKIVLRKPDTYYFSICLLDVDYFKYINDTYGHHIGDFILIRLSEELSKQLRQVDYIARVGGEEFLIVLPFTHVEQAKIVAEHIRGFFEETIFEKDKVKIQFTVSIGVTQFLPTDTIDECIQRADKALYAAKNQGRNKVISI